MTNNKTKELLWYRTNRAGLQIKVEKHSYITYNSPTCNDCNLLSYTLNTSSGVSALGFENVILYQFD